MIGKVGKYVMEIDESQKGIHSSLIRIMNGDIKEREPELLYILRKEIKEGMCCIDLGANIGYVTLLMCDLVGEEGKIYSIEPDPNNLKYLHKNIKLNNYENIVDIYDIAISNTEGIFDFYIGNAPNLNSLIKIEKSIKSIEVKTDTLTNFCSNKSLFPELIKMDIEGGEVGVLEGFYDYVLNNDFSCKIIMELHPKMYSEENCLEYFIKKYLDIGFKTKYVISAGIVQPDLFKEWNYYPIRCFESNRGLYKGFSDENMLEACCNINVQKVSEDKYSNKIARFLMIER
jgi:FkbM family methyltransferase